MTQHGKYPDAFYRVLVKAVIKDREGRILVVKEDSPEWDLPGGGIDHGESPRQAMARELTEEIGYEGDFTMEYVDMIPMYVQRMDACVMFTAYNVALLDEYTPVPGVASSEVAYLDPKEFEGMQGRNGKLIYKFARNPALEVPFL